jgi:hypothetical protein
MTQDPRHEFLYLLAKANLPTGRWEAAVAAG